MTRGGYSVVSVLRTSAFARTALVEKAGVVAVEKRLAPRFREDEEARQRLLTEARVLIALAGRGAPRLLAQGDDAAGPWFVMEHLALPSLGDRLVAPASDAARHAFVSRILPGAFRALRAVHDATDARGPLQIVHGDISPDNLLADDDGSGVAFIDFGLARDRASAGPGSGAFRGTARYVAPEVARGEPALPASDVFSLALTLIHAASLESPRAGESVAVLIAMAGSEPVMAYAEHAARGLPPQQAAFLARCAAFDPEDRPTDEAPPSAS